MLTLSNLRAATLDARARLNDKSIGTHVENGKLQVIRVTYAKGGRSTVTPLSGWLDIGGACDFLRAL